MCDLTRMKRIWSYTTSQILPSKISNKLLSLTQKLKSFLFSSKPSPRFKNYFSSTSVAISLKVQSSSERKRVVMLMGSVQISPCGAVCKREEG